MKLAIRPQSAFRNFHDMRLLVVSAALTLLGVGLLTLFLASSIGEVSTTQITSHAWRIAELDDQGRIVRLGASPFLLALAITVLAMGAAGMFINAGGRSNSGSRSDRPELEAFNSRIQSISEQLDAELADVLSLLSQQIGSNGRYAVALDTAQSQLTTPLPVDQIKRVVHLLIAENTKVRTEITRLQEGLENSQKQIATLRASLHHAETLGFVDSLTSLKNRRWLDTHLEKLAAQASLSAATLSFILTDIDHFKSINDNFGHQAGDEVLKEFARLLSGSIREPDVAVRYGGEEFALVLPGKGAGEAWVLAEGIRRRLEHKAWKLEGYETSPEKVTASFGISELKRGENADTLMRRADTHLYAAKSAGRNTTVAGTD